MGIDLETLLKELKAFENTLNYYFDCNPKLKVDEEEAKDYLKNLKAKLEIL